jgi:hypothetical protein
MITESAVSAAVFDPNVRAALGRYIAPAVSMCQEILDECPDFLCVVFDSAGDAFYMPVDDAACLFADREDARVKRITDGIRSILPGGEFGLPYCRLSVQRHVASLSTYEIRSVPVLSERVDEAATIHDGIHAPVRNILRTIGKRLADGEAALVGVYSENKNMVSGHCRVRMERTRSTISVEQLQAFDDALSCSLAFVRRIGDAARLEQSYDGKNIWVAHAHVVPLPLELCAHSTEAT